jgi:hypothetical protein
VIAGYDEVSAAKTGLFLEDGFRLMELLTEE